jgi:hypothetical protein
LEKSISIFLICNSLDRGSPWIVGIKNGVTPYSTGWIREVVWKEKHHFDIEMNITNERRVLDNIINNKQHLETHAVFKQYFPISLP